MRPIPAYKAGLYGLTEDRQLSNANTKPVFIPVHRTGFSACLNKVSLRGVKRQGNLVAYWERLLRLRAVMHFGVQACARWSLEMTMKKQLVRLL